MATQQFTRAEERISPKHRPLHVEATAATLARPVLVVGDDMRVVELAPFLLERQITAAAVTHGGRIVGFVSMTDLVRDHVIEGDTFQSPDSNDELARARRRRQRESGYHFEPSHETTVGDIMMPFVLTLPESSTPEQAAGVMAAHGVHRLLVLSASREAVGVVHAVDLLQWFARAAGVYVPDDPTQAWRRRCESAL